MNRIATVQDKTSLEKFCHLPPALDRPTVERQQADAQLMIYQGDGASAARCSLWWKSSALYENKKTGYLGHYSAPDSQTASILIEQACRRLRQEGCEIAIGPIDGSTWNQYRLITMRGCEPTFFLEPENPDDWIQHFETNNFVSIAQYYSTITDDLNSQPAHLQSKVARMRALGVNIRAIDPTNLQAELARVYEISSIAFRDNFLYAPISQSGFIAQYESLAGLLRPELILIAEYRDRVVGFLFAIPNLAQLKRREMMDTFIVKTVAVLPDEKFVGLGGLLVARSHEIGAALGFKRAIHALMHETNKSRGISRHYSKPLRRYALYARSL